MHSCAGFARLGALRLLQPAQIPYVCSSCRHRSLRQHIAHLQAIRTTSSRPRLTERLKRAILGSDSPAGTENPYSAPGFFELRRKQKQEERDARHPQQAPPLKDAAEAGADLASIATHNVTHGKRAPRWSVPGKNPQGEDPEFSPAETWEGLERVGEAGIWSERAPAPQESFQPFLASYGPATNPEEFLSALHQAVVEVFTFGARSPLLSQLVHVSYTPSVYSAISKASVEVSENGNLIGMKYEDGARLAILQQAMESCGRDLSGPVQPQKLTSYAVHSLDFLSVPLKDQSLRFAVIKRFSQLSGRLIPDAVLSGSTALRPIYDHLIQEGRPKPAKLAYRLLEDQNLTSLPNVNVMSRRQTPVDRDKQLGRWKIIEAELRSKGLPTLSKSGI